MMSEKPENTIPLFIPIYLNQRIVFDMIAMIEDGLSVLSSINRSSSYGEAKERQIDASVGVGNSLSFFKTKLSGRVKNNNENLQNEQITEERIHTPSSLFVKLWHHLNDNLIIKKIDESIEDIQTGDFVEFIGTLKRNPVIELIENFEQLIKIYFSISNVDINSTVNSPSNKPQNRGKAGKLKQDMKLFEEMSKIIEDIKDNTKIDLICESRSADKVKFVIPTYFDFFINETNNEIIDGEYRILGKVIKVVKEDKDCINLLRNTKISKIIDANVDKLNETFNNMLQELESLDIIKKEDIVIKVSKPAMVVIPIAIFI